MAGLQPHVPRFYRFAATGLGASMWFWVCRPQLRGLTDLGNFGTGADRTPAHVPGEEGRYDDTTPKHASHEPLADHDVTGPVLLGWKHPWDH
jgi:hypothetical protein